MALDVAQAFVIAAGNTSAPSIQWLAAARWPYTLLSIPTAPRQAATQLHETAVRFAMSDLFSQCMAIARPTIVLGSHLRLRARVTPERLATRIAAVVEMLSKTDCAIASLGGDIGAATDTGYWFGDSFFSRVVRRRSQPDPRHIAYVLLPQRFPADAACITNTCSYLDLSPATVLTGETWFDIVAIT